MTKYATPISGQKLAPPSVRPALRLYGTIALLLFGLVALCASDDLPYPFTASDYRGPAALKGWFRYDGAWYRTIAADGYYFRGDTALSSVAFFPVYPLTMRGLHSLFGGDIVVWGVLITALSGLAVSVLFYRWCVPRLGERGARYSLAALLLWPYAWYLFGAVYADALFLALVLGAFSLLERDRLVWATVFAALATVTRPVGIAVVVAMFFRELERRDVVLLPRLSHRDRRTTPTGATVWDARPPVIRLDTTKLRVCSFVPLLSVTGLAAYIAYLAAKFGDPFAFATAQRAPGWAMKPGPRVWFKRDLFDRLVHFPDGGALYTVGAVAQGVLAVALLALAGRVGRRFGWGYAIYVILVLAIPLISSKDFQGLGRYSLAAFPAFAVIGQRLESSGLQARAVLAAALLVLALLCFGFARGKYLA